MAENKILVKQNKSAVSKKYVFWYHFNKPASQSRGKVQVSIHFKGKCLICDNLVIENMKSKMEGVVRKIQPRWVIKGLCSDVKLINGIAHIIG